jgi:hypothetical protein
LLDLSEQTLGVQVRLGEWTGFEDKGESSLGLEFATVVGLVTYANRRRLLRDAQEKGRVARVLDFFRGKGADNT